MSGFAYEPLSASDNTFLELENGGAHMHIAATSIFDAGSLANESGGIDIDKVRAYIASRLHLIPRYRGDHPEPRGGVRHVIPTRR